MKSIADCQLPNADWLSRTKANWQSAIGNWECRRVRLQVSRIDLVFKCSAGC